MTDLKSLFLSPRGRIGRQTFLTAVVMLMVVNIFLGLIPFLGPIVTLPLLWASACVTAKRLHDAGRSGALAFLVGFVCFATGAVAALIGIVATDAELATPVFAFAGTVMLAASLSTIAALALLIWAAVAHGDAGGNRFGPAEAVPLTWDGLLNDGSR